MSNFDSSETQVLVNGSSSLPNMVGSALRYALTALGSFAVAKGWVGQDTAAQIATGILALVPAIWGIWLSHANKKKLVTVASDPRVPDAVAKIK